jgi:hypothetical protein
MPTVRTQNARSRMPMYWDTSYDRLDGLLDALKAERAD